VPDLRQDILLERKNALLSTPTLSSNLRPSRGFRKFLAGAFFVSCAAEHGLQLATHER
jgi:hypothetical protein